MLILADGTEINDVIHMGVDSMNLNIVNIIINCTFSDIGTYKQYFTNPEYTSHITMDGTELNGFTVMKSFVVEYVADEFCTLTVALGYSGLDEALDKLDAKLEEAQDMITMLTDCLLELGDILYS